MKEVVNTHGYRLMQAINSVTTQLAKQLFILPDVLVPQVSHCSVNITAADHNVLVITKMFY